MQDRLHVWVTIQPDLDLVTEVTVRHGSSIFELKQELVQTQLAGSVKPEDFGLALLPADSSCTPEPLPDSKVLTWEHQSLQLCEPGHPEEAAHHRDDNCRSQPLEQYREYREAAVNLASEADGHTGGDLWEEPGHQEEYREPVVNLTFETDGFVEVYCIDVRSLGQQGHSRLSADSLKKHVGNKYKLNYSNKLKLKDGAEGAQLEDQDIVPVAPAEVAVSGPGCVVQQLRMALGRSGPPGERRPGQQRRTAKAPSESAELGLEVTSPEAFAANLNRALAETVGSGLGLRIVFLDVDGVLNSGSSMEGVVDACAQRLAWLVRDAQAFIVLSTTWRHGELGRKELLTELARAGLAPDRVVGCTPEVSGGSSEMERAEEICEWLDAQPRGSVGAWVALDDMDLWGNERLAGHFVQTDARFGLTQANADLARDILQLAGQSAGR